jgi:hypothetical protein
VGVFQSTHTNALIGFAGAAPCMRSAVLITPGGVCTISAVVTARHPLSMLGMASIDVGSRDSPHGLAIPSLDRVVASATLQWVPIGSFGEIQVLSETFNNCSDAISIRSKRRQSS